MVSVTCEQEVDDWNDPGRTIHPQTIYTRYIRHTAFHVVLKGNMEKKTSRGLRKDRVRDMIKDLTRLSSRLWLFLIQVGWSGTKQMQAASRPTQLVFVER